MSQGEVYTELTALPDGTLLADARGFRCSVDGGRTWAPRCAQPAA